MANYLYNGVELSEIPKVEGCEYALIADANGVFVVELSAKKNEAYNDGTVGFGESSKLFQYTDGQWVKAYWWNIPTGDVIWTNYDLYYKTNDSYGELSGTLYLAASEPVPILAPTIEPLSMWMGWKAGNWVARQRGKA